MYWFRLAERLGMSVKEAQQRIDSREFAEWMAMDQIRGPVGPERDDIRAGNMTSIMANSMIGLWSKRGKRFSVEDCTLKIAEKQPKRATQAELRAKMETWRKGVNAANIRKDRRRRK